MITWNDLREFIQSGENLVESEERHVGILMARLMHHDRAVANYQEATPVEAPAAPAVDPAPVAPEVPAAPSEEVSSGKG